MLRITTDRAQYTPGQVVFFTIVCPLPVTDRQNDVLVRYVPETLRWEMVERVVYTGNQTSISVSSSHDTGVYRYGIATLIEGAGTEVPFIELHDVVDVDVHTDENMIIGIFIAAVTLAGTLGSIFSGVVEAQRVVDARVADHENVYYNA